MYSSAYLLPSSRVPAFASQPSLTLSPSEFKSLYMRALTPTLVPAGIRQSGSRPGQTFPPINGITTRVFPRRLLLSTPPRAFPNPILLTTLQHLDYSDDIVLLSHSSHFVYQLPAPIPDNYIIIAITVSVWLFLFMSCGAHPQLLLTLFGPGVPFD